MSHNRWCLICREVIDLLKLYSLTGFTDATLAENFDSRTAANKQRTKTSTTANVLQEKMENTEGYKKPEEIGHVLESKMDIQSEEAYQQLEPQRQVIHSSSNEEGPSRENGVTSEESEPRSFVDEVIVRLGPDDAASKVWKGAHVLKIHNNRAAIHDRFIQVVLDSEHPKIDAYNKQVAAKEKRTPNVASIMWSQTHGGKLKKPGWICLNSVWELRRGHCTPAFSQLIKSRPSEVPDEKLCFSVVGKERTLDVACFTEDEREAWIDGLTQIYYQVEGVQSPKSKPDAHRNTKRKASTDSLSGERAFECIQNNK